MRYYTGDTVHVNFVSVSGSTNTPVTASTTFDDTLFKDGAVYTGATTTVSLVDSSSGMYSATFVPTELGNYQLYVKNDITNVIFVTEILRVVSGDQTIIYVGL
jgi:hypothetical protein